MDTQCDRYNPTFLCNVVINLLWKCLIHRSLLVDLRFSFGVRLDRGVTRCFGSQETKVLVRSRWWLEDGGGLPGHWVIDTQNQGTFVPMGTWPMGDSGSLWVVRISSHNTVWLTDSPLVQGCSLIFFICNKNTWRERRHTPMTCTPQWHADGDTNDRWFVGRLQGYWVAWFYPLSNKLQCTLNDVTIFLRLILKFTY